MFKCNICWNISQKWIWKCSSCNSWNSFEESQDFLKTNKKNISGKKQEVFKFIESNNKTAKIQFQSNELNNVLWYWLTPWSFILLSWEPWIGKSTLALQMADWYAKKERNTLYISAEENIYQISERAKRLKIKNENISIVNANNFEDILETIQNEKSDLIIIDSISVIYSNNLDSNSWSINQVKYITEILMEYSKKSQKSIILIWHVTKDWSISWPKVLEHLVDTVLFIEWSKYENYRILRTFKNRFWPIDEIGLFMMTENWFEDMINPWMEFINLDNQKISWAALGITIEWNRPILIEIEALTTYTKFGYPKRSSRWILNWKLDLLIAVLTKFTDVKLDSDDVYVNISRGLNVSEPGIDLAAIAAIISSKKWRPLWKTIFIWEISLTWIIKNVFNIQKRTEEIAKLGFENIVIPAWTKLSKTKLKNTNLIEIKNINELMNIIKI